LASKKLLYRDEVTAKADELRATPGAAPETGDIDPEGITFTATAIEEMRRQAEVRGTPDGVIRIGIRGGGCNGFAYVFDWDDAEPRDKDKLYKAGEVTVRIDHKSFKYFKGTQLDFVTSMMGHGFQFNNPNAKGACGCGESIQF